MIKKLFSLFRGDSQSASAPTAKPKSASRKGVGGTSTAAATPGGSKAKPEVVSHKPNTAARSPEAICGIDPKKMDRDEIRKKLAELFRRHNQAEASLDAELRAEALVMLDAIVVCRQKYVDGL